MVNPFKKIVQRSEDTKNRAQYQGQKKSPTVKTRKCGCCGAPRPQNSNLAKCSYCGLAFMDIDNNIKADI